MTLTKRSNWPSTVGGSLLSDFFDDRLFQPHWMRDSMPAMNVRENEKNYDIELAVPGYNKSDINVSLDKGVLTVSAEAKDEKNEEEKNYTRREFSCRSFSRSLVLPDNIDENTISAKYVDGVLKLSVNKAKDDQERPRKRVEIM